MWILRKTMKGKQGADGPFAPCFFRQGEGGAVLGLKFLGKPDSTGGKPQVHWGKLPVG